MMDVAFIIDRYIHVERQLRVDWPKVGVVFNLWMYLDRFCLIVFFFFP